MKRYFKFGLTLLGLSCVAALSFATDIPANVNAKRLTNASKEPSQWMTNGGTYEETHYSALNQINKDNVKDLGLSWFADYDTNLPQQGIPLYIDGVIYVSTAWSKVYAFDARTGKQLWKFDPKVPGEWAQKVCCGLSNRGVAAWNGKIYVGTLDARLIAIDAKTGEKVWETNTIDSVPMDSPLARYSVLNAIRVVKGKVITGISGGEFGVRGYISAYDAETGKKIWRFYTVPGNPADGFENDAMKKAAATWSGEWWKVGGGGTVWDAIVYDVKNDLLLFGTGNGTPWNQRNRDPSGGDNLYLASIVAVKPDTGKYVWHYQAVPGDTWDYDTCSPMMIVDLKLNGKQQHVVMQPSKNGFFYILNAKNGKLLKADPFVEMNWADGVDMKTGRPRVRPEARYDVGKPFNLLPGVQGAHGWHANAYSPQTGLIYIATQRAYFPMVAEKNYTQSNVGYNLGIDFGAPGTYYRDHPNEKNEFVGYLQAWDPVTAKAVWTSETNPSAPGGALATAGGLVFQGGGTNKEVRAFDAKTGAKLWSMDPQTGVIAAPITYELDGKQYIAFSVGGNQAVSYYAPNYSRMLVFALNSQAQLPAPKPFTQPALNPPPATASAQVVEMGRDRYTKYCAACHGQNGQTRGATFPDLTRSGLLWAQEAFDQVVLNGVLKDRGMASFSSVLKSEDTQAIRAYMIARATELKAAQAAPVLPTVEQQH